MSETPPIVQDEERIAVASQARLMWWRFRKHKLAIVGGIVVLLFYLIALFADFLAYSDPSAAEAHRALAPPQAIHLWDDGFHPYVHPVTTERDPATFKLAPVVDYSRKVSVCFFCRGFDYKLFGIIPTSIHLLGVEGGQAAETSMFILGTDASGRDMFSRLIYATRTSLTISLAGLVLTLVIGVVLGAISGYYGGFVDTAIQRLIEVLNSIPTLPLWLGLAAALPRDWSAYRVYFAITIIISIIGWRGIAREVRGRFISLRNEDFVVAAELAGTGTRRIIAVHMLPLMTSHLIAITTLALPAMVTAETALSFLGLGLRAPAISWGVMLQQTQNLQSIALAPWLMLPAVPVVIVILAISFLGDGMRDAADPYGV